MKRPNQFTYMFYLLLSVIVLVSSCVQGTGAGRVKSTSKDSLTGNKGGSNPGGLGAIDGSDDGSGGTLFTQKVELSHLVDPFDGTYKKKLTLPKNFKGSLYLAGLNVSALTNKIVYVRFNFGIDKQSVVLNATVARAPGIVPKTDIQVLVIDMNSKPFNKMRLGYDLYDYNTYNDSKDIVTDPRDGSLYCRGLKLEDDPTFVPLTDNASCSGVNVKCLYSYAKVVDSTLYNTNGAIFTSSIPSRPQVWSEPLGVRTPSTGLMAASGCLPDDNNFVSINQLFNLNFPGNVPNMELILGGYYGGPYRTINDSEWQISGAAITNPASGIFQMKTLGGYYYRSMLFPRAGKLSLGQGMYYLGSAGHNLTITTDAILPARGIMTSDSTGTTKYVDGCNLRVLNNDPITNEGISSCNVNSSIEVFYMLDGKEVNITTDKAIKLQLIRPSLTNFEGKEVLSTAFKRCENSSTCGASECCFNSRCWSKDLVTQCVDQIPVNGNRDIGTDCDSDFECGSLCCNKSSGSCAPHNPNGSTPISCNKSAGQRCISKEFCQQVAVVTCKVVKNGYKPDGTAACTLRCPAVMTYGDCVAGACVPPAQPAVPAFDPNDCTNAE